MTLSLDDARKKIEEGKSNTIGSAHTRHRGTEKILNVQGELITCCPGRYVINGEALFEKIP